MRTALLAVLLLAAGLIYAKETKVDFSGEWVFNEEKSEMGEGRGRMLASSLVVTQGAEKISIERTGERRNGETYTTSDEITLDGAENELEGFRGSVRTVTAQWDEEGTTLTISSKMTFERDGNTMEFTSTEVWSMTEDGSLKIHSTRQTRRGESVSILVYDKKE